MPIPTFEEWLRGAIRRLPKRPSELILSGLAVFSWVTAPINFISQISELRIVADFFRTVLTAMGDWQAILLVAWSAVEPLVVAWRALLAPVSDWLSDLLNVSMPPFVVHVILMLLLSLPALIRYTLVKRMRADREVVCRAACRAAFEMPEFAAWFGGPEAGERSMQQFFDRPKPEKLTVIEREIRHRLSAEPVATRERIQQGVKLLVVSITRLRSDLLAVRHSLIYLAFVLLLTAAGLALVFANEQATI